MKIDHERCSESLHGYVTGNLDPETARAVEEHLASCEECRAEHRAVTALTAPIAEELSEMDSHRLHQAVWDELDPASGEHHLGAGVVPMVGAAEPWKPTDRKPIGARLAPVLGIAATLILLFAAGAYVFTSAGGDDDSADSGGVEMLEGGGDGGGAGSDSATDESAGDSTSSEADAARTMSVRWDGRAGHMSAASLRFIGEQSYSTSADGAEDLQAFALAPDDPDGFVRALADASGSWAREVTACGNRSRQDLPEQSYAAYGALATYQERKVLILGFVIATNGSEIDRYSTWIYARRDCSAPIDVRDGRISS